MKPAASRIHGNRGDRGSVLRWLGIPPAAGLAALAFAHAAAGNGVPLHWAEGLGPSFSAWQPRYEAHQASLLVNRSVQFDPAELRDAERRILPDQPLATLPLRLSALSLAARGETDAARQRMLLIERISRRDPAAQLWLLDDAARQNDAAGALRRYDVILRTQPPLRPQLLANLAKALAAEQVRSGLVPFATASNPWFPGLLQVASRQGHADQAAMMLAGLGRLPDTTGYRLAYAAIVAALAQQDRIATLSQLYPRLPGGGGAAALTGLELEAPAAGSGFAPFQWTTVAGADREAAFARAGSIVVRSAPLTRGAVASRLVFAPPGSNTIAWTIEDVASGADAAAYWTARCRDNGRLAASSNMLAGRAGGGTFALPQPCAAADLALVVESGASGEEANFRLSALRWTGTPSPAAPRTSTAFLTAQRDN